MTGVESMLETAQERILLLKSGMTGKQIEELYIKCNNFQIVGNTVFSKKVDINIQGRSHCTNISKDAEVESCL